MARRPVFVFRSLLMCFAAVLTLPCSAAVSADAVGPPVAAVPPPIPSDGRRSFVNEELLIWAGLLNSELGSVPVEEYTEAVRSLRELRAKETGTPLPDLIDHPTLSAEELGYLGRLAGDGARKLALVSVLDDKTGLRVLIPAAIVATVATPITSNLFTVWQSIAREPRALADFGVTRFPPGRYTIQSYGREWLNNVIGSHGCAIKLFHIYSTSDMTRAEGTFRETIGGPRTADCTEQAAATAAPLPAAVDGRPAAPVETYQVERRFHFRAHERNGEIVSLAITYPAADHGRWESLVNIAVTKFMQDNIWHYGDARARLAACAASASVKNLAGRQIVKRIIYGTNRRAGVDAAGGPAFGTVPGDGLHVGEVVVPLPLDEAAAAAQPGIGVPCPIISTTSLDQAKRIQLDGLIERTPELNTARKSRPVSRALLYVHGYANTFEDAAIRAAKIAYDSFGDGNEYERIFVFSWPSKGRITEYSRDADLAEQSEAYLESFMKMILKDRDLDQLDVIVHSLGSQPFLRAIRGVLEIFQGDQKDRFRSVRGEEGRFRRGFGQIVFAAPDVSRATFENRVRPLMSVSENVTLYVSRNDWALWLSQRFLARDARAGGFGATDRPFVMDGLQTIDASGCSNWWHRSNHSYFASNPPVRTDIALVLKTRPGAGAAASAKRALTTVGVGSDAHFMLKC